MQEVEATIINGKGTETGHIIVTTTGGKNGQPKQVSVWCHIWLGLAVFCFIRLSECMIRWLGQQHNYGVLNVLNAFIIANLF